MSGPKVQILDKTVRYRGFFRIDRYRLRHRLFAGGWSRELEREVFERGHAAAILPYDPDLDRVVLIEQFRIGALDADGGPWTLEIVAGIVEEGETPEAVIRREAAEEAGLTVHDVEKVCSVLVSPGGTSESLVVYCGRVDASAAGGIHGLGEEGEDIRVVPLALDDALAMLEDGRIRTGHTIIALQWLAVNRERLRRAWRTTP